MPEVGDPAPDVSLPMAGGDAYDDVEQFELSEALADGPVVLAFFPAAFTGGCTEELCTFRDELASFEALDAQVYGVSVDLPFALNVFAMEQELTFPLLSDFDGEAIEAYDVVLEGLYGLSGVAERSVFVVDTDGVVRYRWVREDGNPDFEWLVEQVREGVAEL
ncbi:MAG: redoxin domain-containing protein [Haloarculaceae archaeon]